MVTELPSISGVSDNGEWDINNRSQVVGINRSSFLWAIGDEN